MDHDAAVNMHYAMCAAEARFLEARNGYPDRHLEASASAGEFIFWACALDEAMHEWTGQAKKAYWAWRDADEVGALLPGLRFLRNRVGHERVVTTRLDDGPTWLASPDSVMRFSAGYYWARAGRPGGDHDLRVPYVERVMPQEPIMTLVLVRRWWTDQLVAVDAEMVVPLQANLERVGVTP